MSKLLINESPLQVLPSLAVAIGLQEAIVLQQIHYWTSSKPPEEDGRSWVFNSFEDWSKTNFPFWSAETCRKIFKSLRDQGLILVKPRGIHAFDKVQKYAINYEVLDSIECGAKPDVLPPHAVKSSASEHGFLPPLYTETTTKKNTPLPPKGESLDPESFNAFWKSYPKKVGKDAAEKAWGRKVKTQDTFKTILEALGRHKTSEGWTKDNGQYIPNPATWLNQGRWKDELEDGESSQSSVDWSRGAV